MARVRSGVFEFDGVAPNSTHRVQLTVRAGDNALRSAELPMKALPERVPTGMGDSLNLLIVSCYSEPTDPAQIRSRDPPVTRGWITICVIGSAFTSCSGSLDSPGM